MKIAPVIAPLLLCLCCAFPLLANPADVVGDKRSIRVLLSGNEEIYESTYTALEALLGEEFFVTNELASSWDPRLESRIAEDRRPELWIAVGSVATEKLVTADIEAPVLSVLIPSTTFAEIVAKFPKAAERLANGLLGAIFMDQPPERQLRLANLILPSLGSVGTVYDPDSKPLVDQLQLSADRLGIHYTSQPLTPNENPLATIRALFKSVDLVLAIPGKNSFNRNTAKWCIYLSYQFNKPLLGFSEEYVRAGALAGVVSRPADLALHASMIVQDFFKAAAMALPPPAFPRFFVVFVNREVSKHLRVTLPSERDLESDLHQQENS